MVFPVALLPRHDKFLGDWIIELGQMPKRKTSGSRALPEVARMVKRARVKRHSPVAKDRYARNIADTMPWSLAV
jgi:hypothetical protein